MALEKPIFIVGPGRNGSTVFHQVLCRHPQLAWISKMCDIVPNLPLLNGLLMKAVDTAALGTLFRKYLIGFTPLKPSEAYGFWEYYCPGFSEPCRDLYREDVTNRKRRRLRLALGSLTTAQRSRLLVKITGWPFLLSATFITSGRTSSCAETI